MLTGHKVRMEQKDRLWQAIKEAGFETPTDAWRANERALGISQDLMISNCNGHRPISKKSAAIYAKVFGRTPGWYLYGDGQNEERKINDQPTISDALKIYSQLPEAEKKEFLLFVLGLAGDDQTRPPGSTAPAKGDKSLK